mgnify:CR=1 FL=1
MSRARDKAREDAERQKEEEDRTGRSPIFRNPNHMRPDKGEQDEYLEEWSKVRNEQDYKRRWGIKD